MGIVFTWGHIFARTQKRCSTTRIRSGLFLERSSLRRCCCCCWYRGETFDARAHTETQQTRADGERERERERERKRREFIGRRRRRQSLISIKVFGRRFLIERGGGVHFF